MTNRQTPPGRMSKLDVVVRKPIGPHHCARCLGSVHTEKTSSRGASNSRKPIIERGSVSRSMLFLATTFSALGLRRFGLELFQIGIEPIKALLEEAAIVLQPFVNILERTRIDAARPPLRIARAADQA